MAIRDGGKMDPSCSEAVSVQVLYAVVIMGPGGGMGLLASCSLCELPLSIAQYWNRVLI